jgi:predicted metalloprotease with PDZ domain
MHLTLGLSAQPGYDWIVEGLAEYYSLELLARSGTISAQRYKLAKADLAKWAKSSGPLCQRKSTGATTARATIVLSALNKEIRSRSEGAADLDDVVRELTRGNGLIGLESLTGIAEQLAGGNLDTLKIDNLPGCRSISTASTRK